MSGYYGKSKVSSPDARFEANIKSIAEQSNAMANAMFNGGARVWELAGHEERDPGNYLAVRDTFSREELDSSCQDVYNPSSPGTDGDAKVVRLQSAYLQAMERAFRLRHCSLARSEAFSAGRRRGQGSETGPLLSAYGVLGYIEKLIELSAKGR
jgi:hypothetical protein